MPSSRTALVAAVVVVSFGFGALLTTRNNDVRNVAHDLFGTTQSTSDEAIQAIEDNYFHDVDRAQLEDASVGAIVKSLKKRYDDRFSTYFNAEDFKQFEETTGGTFSGVGLSVVKVKQGLRVATVFDESPAKAAGIKLGDLVTAVDGRRIAGLRAERATALIKGKPGSGVKLTIRSPGARSRELDLERATVALPVVDGRLVKTAAGKKVAYVRMVSFTSGVHAQLREQIEDLRRKGAEGLILDLRGNGGGLLSEAVLTSSIFVEDGTVVSTSGRTQDDKVYKAVGDALDPAPMIVLINGDTASSSEILTAALRDAGLATLVGQRTFGKGVFQQVIPLDSGGAVSLTVGEYLARDGESLADTGIAPDEKARDILKTKPDEGLQRALSVIASELE